MSANETTSISLTARTGQISLVSADKSLSEYTKKELTSCLDSLKTLLGNAKIKDAQVRLPVRRLWEDTTTEFGKVITGIETASKDGSTKTAGEFLFESTPKTSHLFCLTLDRVTPFVSDKKDLNWKQAETFAKALKEGYTVLWFRRKRRSSSATTPDCTSTAAI